MPGLCRQYQDSAGVVGWNAAWNFGRRRKLDGGVIYAFDCPDKASGQTKDRSKNREV